MWYDKAELEPIRMVSKLKSFLAPDLPIFSPHSSYSLPQYTVVLSASTIELIVRISSCLFFNPYLK
jgi:hypothetical protein